MLNLNSKNVQRYLTHSVLLEKGKYIDIGEPEKVVNKYLELINGSEPGY